MKDYSFGTFYSMSQPSLLVSTALRIEFACKVVIAMLDLPSTMRKEGIRRFFGWAVEFHLVDG